MKKILFFCLIAFSGLIAQAQLNITFKSNLAYPGSDLSNIGGFVDSSGNEYALVGYSNGLDVVDVTDPLNPIVKFLAPGTTSQWREVKTWNGFAYVTTEGCCNGLQIVDLRYLPDSISIKQWKGDGAINGQLETIHALHIEDGYAYLFGSNLFNGAAVIIDLTDPWNPTFAGNTYDTGGNVDSYIHDGYVRNDTLWAGYIYAGYFGVIDVSNKANPVLLTTQNTPTNFTHNTWLSGDGRTLFTTDETNNSFLTSYDISDISNIKELDRIQSNPGSNVIVHNTHIVNKNGADFAVTSWYKDGVVITDVSRPDNLINVGFYDTFTQGAGAGFDGDWGVYPFLPSGNLVCSDISNGLYVLAPTYIRACYLEGLVTDSISGTPLNNVTVQILATTVSDATKLTGLYKTGYEAAGTYDVQFSKAGYITKTITGVTLTNGLVTTLNVQLTSQPTIAISGQVTNSINGNPIPNAHVLITNNSFSFDLTTDAIGNFSVNNFYAETYSIFCGEWMFSTYCDSGLLINGSTGPISIQLTPGIYDDFTFDYGWTVSGPSLNSWERANPIATVLNSLPANPGADVSTDCSNLCFVTDNGGGGGWDNDVDGGNTVLSSPVFDPTGLYVDPVINYSRWFVNIGNNGGGNPDDSMTVKISNGTTTVTLETILHTTIQNGSWVNRSYILGNYIPVTSTMQLILETADYGPVFNVVEGGLDKFSITEGPLGVSETFENGSTVTASPNPFNTNITIHYALNTSNQATLQLMDVTGRLISERTLNQKNGSFVTGESLNPGVYLVRIFNEAEYSKVLKIVKTK